MGWSGLACIVGWRVVYVRWPRARLLLVEEEDKREWDLVRAAASETKPRHVLLPERDRRPARRAWLALGTFRTNHAGGSSLVRLG